jgi:hypothetical protein
MWVIQQDTSLFFFFFETLVLEIILRKKQLNLPGNYSLKIIQFPRINFGLQFLEMMMNLSLYGKKI